MAPSNEQRPAPLRLKDCAMKARKHSKNRRESPEQRVTQARELQSANERLNQEIAERVQVQEALLRSEERFSKAFQSSPIPLAIQSLLNEKFAEANAGFLRLIGYSREELIGQTARQLRIWDEPEGERAMLERLGREMSVRDLPCRFRAKSGRVLEILLSVELIELDGQPFVLAIAHDISEQIKLENQLRQAQKLEAIGQLASGVAHDFNNILAVVQGHASLVLAGKPPDSPDCRPLRNICTAAEHATKLVGQLLNFCRQQVVDLRPADLGEMIGAAAADKLPRLLSPGVKLAAHAPSGLPWVKLDARMMETLLTNLAVNAREAMPEGGQLSITVASVTFGPEETPSNPQMRVGRFVRLSLSDTGKGIPPEVLTRIFEPFFSTKPAGQGTGLGLAAVQGIVKQHHGWLDVQSQVNQGTTFHIYLPVWAEEQPSQTSPAHDHAEPAGARETILVVDDEPDLRDLISQVLETDGYRVLLAGSSAEAIDQWSKRRGNIQLLLTDMVMPDGLTGRKLADRLQSEDPHLRVIYTSGYTAGLPGTELANVDERNFLPKPYRPNTLLRVVRECLDYPGPSANSSRQAA
jgi:two-component system, cell cycle sensor histidine kinase and response regulator CckA